MFFLSVIKGKDVLLNEYIDDLSEKKIFDESLIIRRNYADIKFSRRLDYGHDTDEEPGGVSFNNCDSAASDGFYMFYIHGNLDADNNILFNTSNTTVTMGPFCFKSCSQLDGAVVLEKQQQQVGKKLLTDHQTPLRMSSLQSTQSVRSDEFPVHSQNFNYVVKDSSANNSSPSLLSVASTSPTTGGSTSTISTTIITTDSTTQTSTLTSMTPISTPTASAPASTVTGTMVTSTMSSNSPTTGSVTSISSTTVDQSSTTITTQMTTLSVQSTLSFNVSSSPSVRVSSDTSTQPTQLTSVSSAVPTTNSTQQTPGTTMSQTTNRTSTIQTDTSTSVTTTSSTTTTSTTTNPANVCVFFSKPFNSNDLSVSFDSLTNKTTVKTSLPSLPPNLIVGVFITDVGAVKF